MKIDIDMDMINMINDMLGKEIDYDTIEIEGIEMFDYPDFCDAYIASASYTDGTPLTDEELEKLTEEEGDLINSMIHENQMYL